ncbi:hypothetical protein [Pontibacter sp. G13]|uniref:hypothetical protein n=1 Tax=Pontibacter sp. G13 TaxID=3074898 RepID=UPI00288949F1|nr:hypothetical protein [Pontibacter sp. G13]WNJ20501.1 hypothetical protein RJD25_08465 [Pontibacter sp. G13]
MKIHLETELKEHLEQIWANPDYQKFCEHSYMAPSVIPDTRLHFIGLNPSYTAGHEKVQFFDLSIPEKLHRYYHKFQKIADDHGIEWGYLDLFFFRKTSSKQVEALRKNKNGGEFLMDQQKLSFGILRKLMESDQPQVIVVCNATSRKILKKYFDFSHYAPGKSSWDDLWDDHFGTYRMGKHFWFFSGMLSYGVTENETFRRLEWQLKKVIDHINK